MNDQGDNQTNHAEQKNDDSAASHSLEQDPGRDSLETINQTGAENKVQPASPVQKKQIGPYRILHKIAEGGMGAIFVAEQSEPVKRRVAIKVIKDGRDSAQVITRFDAERQALAMMDHQNIARVLDAGADTDGSPYFVMELIQGIPINKYCDENKLSLEERLNLFIPVCKAVQHAHQKGILHRDLKPSNVLVAIYDGKPVPKVIDFGLAKALQHAQKLTDKTMITELGKVVGTLQYMSPEQARADAMDVDTRTDIYALGVMLYELLTGSTPLETATLGTKALLQVLAIIRDTDPPRPSDRLSHIGDSISGISDQRQILPSKLRQILRGELDWVVMKALEKDRTRRYESASGFADDLQRYLSGDAVLARPPSTAYRLSKLVRKNRGLVTSAAIMTLLLLSGIAGTTYGLVQAKKQTKLAVAETARANKESQLAAVSEQAAKQSAQQSNQDKQAAEMSAKRSRDVLQILTRSFRSIDPKEGADALMPAKDVLLRALESVDASSLDDLGKAQLLESLSSSLTSFGEYEDAIAAARKVLSIRTGNLGDQHPDTLIAMNNLARSLEGAGQSKEAIELLENALPLQKTIAGANHPDTLVSMRNLANSYQSAGRSGEAFELNERLLQISKDNFGDDHPRTLSALSSLASSYFHAGKNEKAIELSEQVLQSEKTNRGLDHPVTLVAMSNLATGYEKAGRHSEALQLTEQIVKLRESKLGEDHPHTLSSIADLAALYMRTGRKDEAIKLQESVLEVQKSKSGISHPVTMRTLSNLAACLREDGQHKRATELNQQAFELRTTNLGPEHPDTMVSMHNLATCYFASGEIARSIELHERTLRLRQDKLGPDHPETLTSMVSLGHSLSRSGKINEAIELTQKALQLQDAKGGAKCADTGSWFETLMYCHLRTKKIDKAIDALEKAVEFRTALNANGPDTRKSIALLANLYSRAGQTDKAIIRFEDLLVLLVQQPGRGAPETLDSQISLGKLLTKKDSSRAVELLTEVYETRSSKSPEGWTTFDAQSALGEALFHQGTMSEADKHLQAAYSGLSRVMDRIPANSRAKTMLEAIDRLILFAKKTGDEESINKWTTEKEALVQKLNASRAKQ